MEKKGRCTVTYGDDVETLSFGWGNLKLLCEPERTGCQTMTFGMVVLDPGNGHTRHNHPNADEIIFVVSGTGEQMLDDEAPIRVGPGASIYIPRGVYHGTLNTGWEPMRLIVVYAPAGEEEVLRSLDGLTIVPPGMPPTRG